MDYLQRPAVEESVQDYRDGRLNRREFLRRLAVITGSSVLALSLAELLGCGPGASPTATALPVSPTPTAAPTATPTSVPTATPTLEPGVTVRPDDPSLEAGPVEFRSDGITLLGYLARPKAPGPHPAMLVIHENRGLLPHFPDVARRLAKAGFVSLALDLLSRQGGTGRFPDPAAAGAAFRQVSSEQSTEDMNSGVRYLQSLPYVRRERLGAVGFCAGGGLVWLLAVRNPELKAAVPFYGSRPPLGEVPNLRAAVLGIYAGNDNFINPGVPELEAALKQQDKTHRFITYPGADHSFFNDTNVRYHPEAAAAAWRETLAWLDRHLKG
jgi:carboxymethylenebutenolidase